jgi:hypothetical protein
MTVTLLTALLLSQAPSTDPAAKAEVALEKQRQEELAALAPAKAKMLELRVGDEKVVKASLHGEPLLRWSNPTAGSVYGEVFLWHVDGRPAAIASIYRWYHPFKDSTVEIVSLSPSAVSAREGDDVLWDCRAPGVSFQPLADVAAPAASRGGRLTQMRSLARRFTARLSDERGGERVSRELRLLNQPIHRYESAKQGLIDGALFALAEVTDPEVIVIFEAVKEGDSPKWRYALARMNNHALEVRLDGNIAQSWPRIEAPWKNRKSHYTLFTFNPALVKIEQPTGSSKEAQP